MESRTLIPLREFQDLWIHTGTACNLSCPFCHEGSSPGDSRLQAISAAEVLPVLRAAATAGARRFILTGGEPLILKGIQELLLAALALHPVLVLTNGTAPWIRRSQQLAALRSAANPLSFRVSLDTPDEAAHDAQRGFRNFRKAVEGLKLLHAAGFEVGITRQHHGGEDAAQIAQRFRQLLRKHGLPGDLSIVAIPQLGALVPANGPPMTNSGAAPGSPLCSRGRMLIRRDGELKLTACALVDDDPIFDRPPDIESALATPINPLHRRCSLCRSCDVNYVGAVGPTGV
ncbi:MAG: radical SAM protein [Steroidobacteraceae bacterium]